MNSFWIHIIHQAVFGGIASAGFGILFNCSPRTILHCLASGAMALAIRTACQSANLNLPESAFFAALSVAAAERVLRRNRRSNQRDEKSSGGYFDFGGDRNRLGYPTTDISRKRGFGQKQNFTLDPLAGKKVQKRVNFRRRPIAPA